MSTTRTLNEAWQRQLIEIVATGRQTAPRGQVTLESPSRTLVFDMNYPVITFPERKMGYKFMTAEAWWILDGRDDVESIAPYAKHIVNFSDDGHKFFGAYGPRIMEQVDYVVETLLKDRDTRQAVLTTWRTNPEPTKDVPCTVAFSWLIRGEGQLECHVFMRSSDNWLGIPYDAFNFTMLTCEIARRYNACVFVDEMIMPGTMHLTAASSHVYDKDMASIKDVIKALVPVPSQPVPSFFYNGPTAVKDMLTVLKDSVAGYTGRWWEQ